MRIGENIFSVLGNTQKTNKKKIQPYKEVKTIFRPKFALDSLSAAL